MRPAKGISTANVDADAALDDQAVRELCARMFSEPARLLNTLMHRVEQRFNIEPHAHVDLLQFDLLVGCTGRAWSEARWVPIQGITCLVAYPNEPHGYELLPGQPPSRVYHLKVRVDPTWPVIRRRTLPRAVTGMRQDEALIAATRLSLQQSPVRLGSAAHMARLAEMICLWPRNVRGAVVQQGADIEPWVADAMQTIKERVSDPPGLDELASAAGVSTRHFARQFLARTGTTPHHYINGRRLGAARELLLQNQLKVRQIAQAVGFSSAATFSRWFTQQTGMNPRQYRLDPSIL